jgi:hypothetical protein
MSSVPEQSPLARFSIEDALSAVRDASHELVGHRGDFPEVYSDKVAVSASLAMIHLELAAERMKEVLDATPPF